MLSAQQIQELRDHLRQRTDDYLLHMVGVGSTEYDPAAVEIAREECARRQITTEDGHREADLERVAALVAQKMKAGEGREPIIDQVAHMGVERPVAAELVETMRTGILQQAQREQFGYESLLPALLGASLAAVIGGCVWGAIVIGTGYEIGYMATGIGAVVGYAVVVCARGQKGTPLQVIATLASLLGIAVGKYVAFHYYVSKAVTEEYGAEAARNIPILSGRVIQAFLNAIPAMLRPFDALWVGLAVLAAWRIPRGLGITLPDHLKTR